MKSYEAATDQQLPANQPALIRIDGHGFSKFTKGFDKPFDERIHTAMAQTAEDLLAYFFDASLALAAGYASVRFYHHLAAAGAPAHKQGIAHFDARAFAVPDAAEALNNLIWRAKIDCRRNSISAFGRGFYSARDMTGLSSDALVEKVLAEKNVDFWTSTPSWARNGTTVKRELYEGTGIDGLTGAEVKMTRTRMRSEDIPWWEFNERNLALVTERYWDGDLPIETH
ncbi:tRNAHis guanylyltransferase-domain-containing protein [Mycena vulgaris]|nr:tRNAHis guanylyltransferase-domain-containing protein [Mycena vulgaris]